MGPWKTNVLLFIFELRSIEAWGSEGFVYSVVISRALEDPKRPCVLRKVSVILLGVLQFRPQQKWVVRHDINNATNCGLVGWCFFCQQGKKILNVIDVLV